MERGNGNNGGGDIMPLIQAFSMFFLSFSPLWVSVLFIDLKSICEKNENLCTEIISVIVILIVMIISLLVFISALNPRKRDKAKVCTVISASEEKTITAEYLLSYILPLFAFDFTLWHQVVLFLIFFTVLAFLCIRHNHFSVNIVLEILRYRFYRCKLTNDDGASIEKVIITRNDLTVKVNSEICIRPINNDFAVQILPSQ